MFGKQSLALHCELAGFQAPGGELGIGGLNVQRCGQSFALQDAAFSTIPRLAAFLFGFLLLLPWMLKQISAYSISIFGDLARYAR